MDFVTGTETSYTLLPYQQNLLIQHVYIIEILTLTQIIFLLSHFHRLYKGCNYYSIANWKKNFFYLKYEPRNLCKTVVCTYPLLYLAFWKIRKNTYIAFIILT
jgi:hypothetical protein